MTQSFDPQALIDKARKGPLRHGEVEALSTHLRGLERSVERASQYRERAAAGDTLTICLNADMSALVVIFPGAKQHSVSIPLGRADLAMDFIVKALSERRRDIANPQFIGTPGAPSQADLLALAKAKPARKVGKVPACDIDLADLGL